MNRSDMPVETPTVDAERLRAGSPGRFRVVSPYLVAGVLSLGWVALVHAYSVNVLFSDQWDIYRPFLEGGSPWHSFFLQHGPHRQGLGGLLNHLMAATTGLSVVTETYVIVLGLSLSAFLAIPVKRAATGRTGPEDLFIPFLILNPIQCETVIAVPNISHSVLPLLLFFLVALIYLNGRKPGSQLLLASVLAFTLFTGFGLFVFLPAGLLILSGFLRNPLPIRKRLLRFTPVALVLLGALLLFLKDYAVNRSGLDEITDPVSVSAYVFFVAHLFGRFFNTGVDARLWIGLGVLGLTLVALVRVLVDGRTTLQSRPQVLIVYSILVGLSYGVFSSLGRIAIFVERNAGTPFRYTTLMIPALFGLLLFASMLKRSWLRRVWLTVFCSLAVTSGVSSISAARGLLARHESGKSRWVAAYLETADAAESNKVAGYAIYPAPELIEGRLQILHDRKLSFQKDQPPESADQEP